MAAGELTAAAAAAADIGEAIGSAGNAAAAADDANADWPRMLRLLLAAPAAAEAAVLVGLTAVRST